MKSCTNFSLPNLRTCILTSMRKGFYLRSQVSFGVKEDQRDVTDGNILNMLSLQKKVAMIQSRKLRDISRLLLPSIVIGGTFWLTLEASFYYRPRIAPDKLLGLRHKWFCPSNSIDSIQVSNIKPSFSPLNINPSKMPFCVTMCGCGHCYNFSLVVDSTTCRLITNVTEVSVRSFVTERPGSNETAYFDFHLEGSDGLFATIISVNDTELLNTLEGIYLNFGGDYNLSISLQYLNKTSAFALGDVQPRPMECILQNREEGTVVVHLNQCNKPSIIPERRRWKSGLPNDERKVAQYNMLQVKRTNTSYQLLNKRDKSVFVCPIFPPTPLLQQCVQRKTVLLLGDSFIRYIFHSLKNQINNLTNYGWAFQEDGQGIYTNVAYGSTGSQVHWGVPFQFKEGPMLRKLRNGVYRQLQEKHHFDVWVISSGQWDMRDVTVDDYVKHVEELFQEWTRFQRSNYSFRAVWNGVPAFSYRHRRYGTQDHRTNVKIAMADERVKILASKYNITYVPYFDISFPFYWMSVDTHHYLMDKSASPIGSAQLNILLNAICQ